MRVDYYLLVVTLTVVVDEEGSVAEDTFDLKI